MGVVFAVLPSTAGPGSSSFGRCRPLSDRWDPHRCHHPDMSPWWIVVALAGAALAGAAMAFRAARRDAAAGRFEVALRVVDGTQAPLTGRWRHGVLSPFPGRLSFRPGGPGGLRLPRGRPFDVPVASVAAHERSHPARRQMWTIDPSLHVVRLTTPTGTVELAAHPAELDRVLSRLAAAD